VSVKDHVELAQRYVAQVLSGEIPACKWTRLACERQRDDLVREPSAEWPWVFDPVRARRVCEFLELLPHIKGKWARAGRLIELESWQCFLITTAFGWVHRETGLRRFREVYLEVPRKNAKSTLSSGVALYMLTADGEHGAEVYSAATTKDQAKIVFADATD
jgi:phage terminase large subunit-like protein